jgi:segregation and condensation protein B
MLRLVKEDDVELDESLDEEMDVMEDMHEPDMQADAERQAEAQDMAAEPSDELPDGAVDSAADEAGQGGDLPPVNPGVLEALLLSTHHPLTAGRLAEILDLPSTKPVRTAIKDLNAQYEATGRCFRIEQVAGGFQILTLPEFGESLKKLHLREADAKLTKAALETLAIIAYKQPILRANIEAIRGVACGETIRSLMEKHLVKIAGRAEEPGRPILYGTTKRFLELFGLNSLKDLPQPDALKPVEQRESRVTDIAG